ncbi:MAG: hypothetical protein JNL70_12350 [Saprospiraceae bacterium]|nr:hypothetical protein [Saprospiraceae bacterium]
MHQHYTLLHKKEICYTLLFIFALFIIPHTTFAQGYVAASTYLGGTNSEQNPRMVVLNGESYILGNSTSNNFPITLGSAFGGGAQGDLVVTKLAANGDVIWSRYLGGSDNEYPNSIVVSNGSVFIAGNTVSSDYPVTNGSAQTGVTQNAIYTKLNASNGAIQFSTYLGKGSLSEISVVGGSAYLFGGKDVGGTLGFQIHVVKYDINTDNIIFDQTYGGTGIDYTSSTTYSGRTFQVVGSEIFLIGGSMSTDFPVTNGSTRNGSFDHIYMKLNGNDGNTIFSTYIGGTTGTSDYGVLDLRVDNGGVYIFGITEDTDFPVTDGSTKKGLNDFYLMKFNASTNAVVFSKYLGTPQDEYLGAMEVQNGIVYLSGWLGSNTGYPHTVLPGSYTGSAHLFFTKLDGINGSITYSTWLHSNSYEDFGSLKVVNGDAYILGLTGGNTNNIYPVTNGSKKTGSVGDDIVLTKINSNNQICFSTFIGGNNDEYPTTVAVENDFVYIIGTSGSNNYPVTNNTSKKIGNEYIWTKFNLAPNLVVSSDDVLPATQTVCKNGIATPLTGSEILFPSDSMPILYRNGVPSPQNVISLKYQWQKANAAAGPWTDIAGGVQMNYTPEVGLTDQYYRRLTNASVCSTNTPLSTSSVVAVLVNSNTAPTVNAGNVINTCSGNTVTLGGSPAATGNAGATIVSYSWAPTGTYTPSSTVANPTVSPTANTIYTLTATDNNGCQQIGQALVNVYAANAGVDVGSCAGGIVRIGSAPIAGLAGVTYAWTASPADPTMSCTDCAQPDVHPSVVTTYTLTLTVPITGGGTCSTTDAVVVTPVAAPVTPNFAGPDVVICIGSTAPLGTPAESGFTYTWAPGNYLTSNNASTTTFQPGSLSMPTPNGGLYYLTAVKSGCSFVDQMQTAVIEARAGVDGCGPRYLGEADRTPSLNETYTWTKISGPGNFVGATNIPQPFVSASVGGATTYELTVSYTLNGVTQSCTDQVVVPDCGCVVDIKVEAPFSCPSFGLNNGNVKLIATAADIFSQDPSVFSYTWSPSVGLSASTGREVFLTDNVNRTYTVTMSSPNNPSFQCTRTIEVNHPAWSLPIFTAQDLTTCPATSVNVGQAPIAGYDYKWTDVGGNLNATTASNPTAIVNSTTSFPVLVTDIGSGCTARDTATVTIEGFPANIAGDDVAFCGSSTVQLGKAAVPNVTYLWTPATTYTPSNTSANPSVTVATTTTFHVVATNSITGCSVNDDVVVTVKSPVAPFSFTNQTYCPSTAGALPLPAGPSGMTTYSWSPASLVTNPTSNGPTATTLTTRPTSATTYTLTVGNVEGCTASASVVFTPEVTNPVAGDNKTICKNTTAQLGATPALPGTYTWTGTAAANLSSTSISDPVFTPTATGVFTFTVSKTDPGGCITTANVTITVVDFTLPALSSPTVCENTCIQIGTSTTSAGAQYFWSPTTGLSDANIPNPMACVGTTSTTYKLTAVGVNGCVATQNVVVGVNPSPAPTVTIPTVTACLGDSNVQFTPTVTPSGTYNYQWFPTNGTLSNTYVADPKVYITGVGSKQYTVIVTNAATGCASTATANLTVDFCPPCTPPSTPSVPPSVTNSCPATRVNLMNISQALTPSVSGGVFEWHVSNDPNSTLVNTPNSVGAGNYYLFEKGPTGCYSNGVQLTVNIQVCCPTALCIPITITRAN